MYNPIELSAEQDRQLKRIRYFTGVNLEKEDDSGCACDETLHTA